MVDVIKRRITGVSEDAGELVKIDMANISPASFSTALPATKSVATGADLTLTVVVAGGLPPYSYQWFFNNIFIDPAINPTAATAELVNHAVTAASAGLYKVVVHDEFGNLISGSTAVTVTA